MGKYHYRSIYTYGASAWPGLCISVVRVKLLICSLSFEVKI